MSQSDPYPTRDARSRAQLRRFFEKQRERWSVAKKVEHDYARQLIKVAKQVGHIVDGLAPDGVVEDLPELDQTLIRYSQLIGSWARAISRRMILDVDNRGRRAWRAHSRAIGRALRDEYESQATGAVARQLMQEQVMLIQSLPLEAAQRVHKYVREAQIDGQRAAYVAEQIKKTGEITQSRAILIARTEASRTSFTLTKARALSVGSKGYIWRTALDSDVRETHQHMEGKYVLWTVEPQVEPKHRYHAGCFPNCRCYPEPLIDGVTL